MPGHHADTRTVETDEDWRREPEAGSGAGKAGSPLHFDHVPSENTTFKLQKIKSGVNRIIAEIGLLHFVYFPIQNGDFEVIIVRNGVTATWQAIALLDDGRQQRLADGVVYDLLPVAPAKKQSC